MKKPHQSRRTVGSYGMNHHTASWQTPDASRVRLAGAVHTTGGLQPLGTRGRMSAQPPAARPPGPQISCGAGLEPAAPMDAGSGAQPVASRDAGPRPARRLPRSRCGLRCLPAIPLRASRSSPQLVRTWSQDHPQRHKSVRANHVTNQGNSRFTAPLDGPFNP